MKSFLNVAPSRNIPEISPISLRKWYKKNYASLAGPTKTIKSVYFFVDEFTNHNDTHIGIKAISLLKKLGYEVRVVDHQESGRSALSKGLLEKAKKNMRKQTYGFSRN